MKRLGAKNGLLAKIAFAVPVSILSPIAYDVFAASELSAGGSKFPLFLPLSFRMIDFPSFAWPIIEGAAFLVALLVQLSSNALF